MFDQPSSIDRLQFLDFQRYGYHSYACFRENLPCFLNFVLIARYESQLHIFPRPAKEYLVCFSNMLWIMSSRPNARRNNSYSSDSDARCTCGLSEQRTNGIPDSMNLRTG